MNTTAHALNRRAAPALPRPRRLDESQGFLGMSRSLTFPYHQWQDQDPYRTVFFDEGQGRTLVLVHGLGANATHWEFVARRMLPGHRVVGLDLAGCGWTRKPQQAYTIQLLRDQLLDFLDRRGIGRATLVGHSLGGAVCLDAALQRPDQFDGLVLVCAAGVAPLPRWMRAAAPLFLRRWLLYPTLRMGADRIVDNIFVTREQDNPHVRWFRQAAMRDEPGSPNLRDFARVCESLCRDVARRDYSPHFPTLGLPVMALWGDRDRLTSLSPVLKQLGRIPRVRTVVLPRCGHMPMIEYPAETVRHLQRFLSDPP